MTWALASYAIGVALLGLYCLVVLPRHGWRRVAAPILLAAMFLMLLVTGLQALGRPRPAWTAMPGRVDARLLAYALDEGRAIYLWLAVPGAEEPVAYSLPWREEEAVELHEASRRAAAGEGDGVMIEGEFGPRAEGEWKAYPAPQPPAPPKE